MQTMLLSKARQEDASDQLDYSKGNIIICNG